MGMYDYLKIKTDKLPLTDEEKSELGDNPDWQTKDFECILSTAEITDDGKLRFLWFRYEWDENAESALSKYTNRKGALVTRDEEWIDIQKHGYVNFYTSVEGKWYEFNAKFTDGKLTGIERVL